MCIQETYDESKTPIRNYKPDNESEDYRLDKIYFDRENTGITIGNYASETNRFNLISRTTALDNVQLPIIYKGIKGGNNSCFNKI